jgi:hypothetical protein
VIGTVRGEAEARQASPGAADHVVSLHSGPIPAMRQVAPAGVDRIIEVALSAKADLDAAIVRNGAVLAAYASPKDRPELPFRPMLFANVTMRLLGSDDFPLRAKDSAARDLTHAAAQSALSITNAEIVPLAQIAAQIPAAQELIESGRPQAGCSCRFPSAGRGRATRARGSICIRADDRPTEFTRMPNWCSARPYRTRWSRIWLTGAGGLVPAPPRKAWTDNGSLWPGVAASRRSPRSART